MAQLIKYSTLENKEFLLDILNIKESANGSYENAFANADEKYANS